MEENKEVQVTETDFDSFDDGWDDETRLPEEQENVEEVAEDEPAEEPDGEPEQDAEEDEDGGEEPAEPIGDHTDTEPEPEPAKPETFSLKHMDEIREVDREEMTRLAQMGLDYGRIRDRADKYEAFLKEMAGEKSIEELIDSVRAAKLAKDTGMDSATALERVKLEREKKEFEARQGKQKEEAESKARADQAEQKRRESFLRFAKEYPDVKPQEIPKEVWKSVSEGMELADAYALHENKQLRERVKTLEAEKEALEQNAKNKERTAGSRATAGKKKETDPFDDGWDAW